MTDSDQTRPVRSNPARCRPMTVAMRVGEIDGRPALRLQADDVAQWISSDTLADLTEWQ